MQPLQEPPIVLLHTKDLPPNSSQNGRETFSSDVAILLVGMGMEKYMELFKENDINLEMFLGLTNDDLLQLGIVNQKDRKEILSHLRNDDNATVTAADLYPPDRPAEDLMIAQNILKESLLLHREIAHVLNLIEGEELQDYFVTTDVKASQMLKLVTEKCVQQTTKICESIYDPLQEKKLVNSILKKYNLRLPVFLREKIMTRRKLRTKRLLWILASVGVCSLAGIVAYWWK